MNTFFLTCAVVGAVILVAQLALSAFGGHHGDSSHGDASHGDASHSYASHNDVSHGGASGQDGAHSHASDGLQLLSARAVSAAVAFFGIGALGVSTMGLPSVIAVAGGVVLGGAAVVGVAYTMRSMLRLESDGSINIYGAVGTAATVYIPIPGGKAGRGKVSLTLQGRTVEYQAVTAEGSALPTGMSVVVVDVHSDDTVEVAPLPSIDGVM